MTANTWRERIDAQIGRCPDCDEYTWRGYCPGCDQQRFEEQTRQRELSYQRQQQHQHGKQQ